MRLPIEVELDEIQFEQLLKSGKVDLTITIDKEGVFIDESMIWPKTNGFNPAEYLIRIAKSRNLRPEELQFLSKNRVMNLFAKYGGESTVQQMESVFGFSFSGPFNILTGSPLSQYMNGHSANALARASIWSLTDLRIATYKELRKTRGIGDVTIKAVKELLIKHGYELHYS